MCEGQCLTPLVGSLRMMSVTSSRDIYNMDGHLALCSQPAGANTTGYNSEGKGRRQPFL